MTEMVRRIRKKMDEAGNKGDLIISVNAFVPNRLRRSSGRRCAIQKF